MASPTMSSAKDLVSEPRACTSPNPAGSTSGSNSGKGIFLATNFDGLDLSSVAATPRPSVNGGSSKGYYSGSSQGLGNDDVPIFIANERQKDAETTSTATLKRSRWFWLTQERIMVAVAFVVAGIGGGVGVGFGAGIAAGALFAVCFVLIALFYLSVMQSRAKRATMTADAAITERYTALLAAMGAERALNEFIAHEIRNPLSVCCSAISFVQAAVNKEINRSNAPDKNSGSGIKPQNPLFPNTLTGVLDDLQTMNVSLGFIDEMLRNLLDLNRFSVGLLELRTGPTCMRQDILEPVKEGLIRNVNNGVSIELDCPVDFWVQADRARLLQLVNNVAQNALRFVSKGFLRLRVIRDKDHPKWIHVIVEDSGPGIAPDECDHLFQKYQETLDTMRQGTGVGLALAKLLAEKMDGSIHLDPTFQSGVEGCPGARFQISLPLPETVPDPAAASAQNPNLKPFRARAKVLHVDDDKMVRMIVSRMLKRVARGWEFDQASSGEEALTKAAQTDYDLIIMDHYMPDPLRVPMTGEETIRKLREQGYAGAIIGCSANDMSKEHLLAGADRFVLKPLPAKPNDVAALLNSVLPLPTKLDVLVVSNNSTTTSMVVRTINRLGTNMSVQTASTEQDALLKAQETSFHIILLDLSDSTFTHRIRETCPNCVLVLITGSVIDDETAIDLLWSKPLPSDAHMKQELNRVLFHKAIRQGSISIEIQKGK